MSYEYYNLGMAEYLDNRPDVPEEPTPNGCLWRLIVMMLICILLGFIKSHN